MSSYKLIQDIEAEDHILGPLTLKQFIFLLVFAFCMYFVFLGASKKIWILLPVFVPPALVTGFFAFPFGKDQPTEVWALAKIKFIFKPKKRIWDQNGMKDLVTINAPQKVEKNLTKDMSQSEVQSRLKALANTLDSRGWAVKHNNSGQNMQSGRLLDVETATDYTDLVENTATDIFDDKNGPLANHFGEMLNAQTATKRKELEHKLEQPLKSGVEEGRNSNQNWFNNPTVNPVNAKSSVSDAGSVGVEDLGTDSKLEPKATPSNPALTALSQNNDLNISTIARQAAEVSAKEVTIDLQ